MENKLLSPNFVKMSNTTQVESFIKSCSVDMEYVKTLDPEDRNVFLINQLFTTEELSNVDREQYHVDNKPYDESYGMMLIKPEMFPYTEDVENYMLNIGLDYYLFDKKIPSKQDWLKTYGYMLFDYPNIINVYITQRSLGFRPMLFKHLSTQEYADIADKRNITLDSCDRDAIFDQLFCGKAKDGFSGTVRGDIVLPRLKQLGFDDMSGYAKDFDVSNFYKDSDLIKTYTSFNGIHLPKNKYEKEKNIKTYINI